MGTGGIDMALEEVVVVNEEEKDNFSITDDVIEECLSEAIDK